MTEQRSGTYSRYGWKIPPSGAQQFSVVDLSNPFPSNPRDASTHYVGWEDKISAYDIVHYFGGDAITADEKALLVEAMNASGASSPIDFTGSIVLARASGEPVTAGAVIRHATDSGLVAPVYQEVFEALENANDFSIGLYIAAFDRAGEYEGVQYWKGVLSDKVDSGLSMSEALKSLAGDMYYAGWIHGEGGTDIADTREYVAFVYQNVLGRNPDAGGHDYWTREIDSGTIPREKFLADFLYSALQAQGDSDYLSARIEVATYVAREAICCLYAVAYPGGRAGLFGAETTVLGPRTPFPYRFGLRC